MQGQSRGTIAIIGQGYVGLPLSVGAAKAGWTVIGIDKSPRVIEGLRQGRSHIEDVSSATLSELLARKSYQPTESFDEISSAEICVVCVPTPLDEKGNPNTEILESAIASVAPHLKAGTVLINESTSYPGTLRDLIFKIVEKHRAEGVSKIHFASAPERIDPQNLNWNLSNTPRLISGLDEEAREIAISFYSTICENVVPVSSPEVAELAKLLENTFRQVNIALVNQLVPFCKAMGIDIREVVEAAGTKPYGYLKFYPGAGVGGHCIPVDPMYLLWKSRELGVDLPFIQKADEVNGGMPRYVVDRALSMTKGRIAKKFLIMGIAYKSGVGDVRESPAIEVIDELRKRGFGAVFVDPFVSDVAGISHYSGEELRGVIVVTAQPGMKVEPFINLNVPILDCTGAFKRFSAVEQL